MITGTQTFNFVDKKVGVNGDGEKYIAVDVLAKDGRKFSFISKNPDVVDKISQLNISRLQEIKLQIGFDKVFNPKTRYSNWQCELVGVG